ncbi:thiol-disulfide isomerase/thioredoxin [Gillisia sp. Hel_I_86]|uniref:TlpA family protein disulfide reductase n=1 Tax=Gillisia sp. Hel_I_86 TaxID=1249981 RepID=UPI00119B0E6E|nr:TlpA disulfide reductase family protein [Gillisia sp. Hel_I_86]TVZ27097.1 thiol-disulfide isomerase/thioredoxin [Gillisia sp. Hel_I_86]
MNKKTKNNLIEFGITGTIILTLFLTGLHTEVFGFVQRGILKTGLMDPDVESKSTAAELSKNPKADFNLSLINSKGERVEMEELRGKVIFFNIWATWCPPCVAEMPGINNMYNDMKGDDIAFIMLSVDNDFQKAIDFNKRKGYDFEVYKLAGSLPPMYASQAIPTTYIIDSKGNLALTHEGMGDYDSKEFKAFLTSLK